MTAGRPARFADRVLMIRPAAFGPNPETAASNAFQRPLGTAAADDVREAAVREHDGLAAALRAAGVDVIVVDDTPVPITTDAVFPNNWVSFHETGEVILYPMACPSRAAEVRADVIEAVERRCGAKWPRRIDLTARREAGEYLEGTGSLVLDRPRGIAWAALSPRTSPRLVEEVAGELGLAPRPFTALDGSGRPIYHTNVMLAVGARFAVVCGESLADDDRDAILGELARDRDLIDIDLAQTAGFAANLLELRSRRGDPVIALSDAALDAFTPAQRGVLERHGALAHAPIPVLERHGGGSVRCTVAEVFPPGD